MQVQVLFSAPSTTMNDNIDIAKTIVVLLHVLSAVVLVGGAHHYLLAVLPVARRRGKPEDDSFARDVARKFQIMTVASAGLLLLTGLHLFGVSIKTKLAGGLGMTLFMIKLPLALLVLGILVALCLPMEFLDRMREKQRLWLRVALFSSIVVIGLGAFLAAL